jgi:hypothetical protein
MAKEKKRVKFLLWSFYGVSIAAFICLGTLTSIFLYSGEKDPSESRQCDCRGWIECQDIGDAEWIIVEGRSETGTSLFRARKSAISVAKRQLLWCIDAMPLEGGVCLFNKIKDREDAGEVLKILLDEKTLSNMEDLIDGETTVTLKLRREDVLSAFGIVGATGRQAQLTNPNKEPYE